MSSIDKFLSKDHIIDEDVASYIEENSKQTQFMKDLSSRNKELERYGENNTVLGKILSEDEIIVKNYEAANN